MLAAAVYLPHPYFGAAEFSLERKGFAMKDYLQFALLVLVLFASPVYAVDTDEETLQAIVANLHENFAACTDENLERLLATMSEEMPNRKKFIKACQSTWNVNDAYHRLEDVKLLKRSTAPFARTDFPYATVVVTQTILQMSSRPENASVFRSSCENGRCKTDDEMAHLMSLSTNSETTRLQMLFKKEHGKWKLIAGLTRPEPVDLNKVRAEAEENTDENQADLSDVGVREAQPRHAPGHRSVFN
jgi:hypothetical protein